jgi:hypothetical protein
MELFVAQDDNIVTSGRYQSRVKLTGKCQELTNTATEASACTAGAGTAR